MLTAQGNWINIDLTGESCYLFILLLDNPPVAVASGSIVDKDKHPLEPRVVTLQMSVTGLSAKDLVWGRGGCLLNSFSPPFPWLSPHVPFLLPFFFLLMD